MRHRPPALTVLQFAIGMFISWQVYRAQAASDAANPLMAADEVFRAVIYIFLGTFAIFALNLLYPLAAWGIGRLRERQDTLEPEERLVMPSMEAASALPQLQRLALRRRTNTPMVWPSSALTLPGSRPDIPAQNLRSFPCSVA